MYQIKGLVYRGCAAIISMVCFMSLSAYAAYNLLPWSTNTQPSDVSKSSAVAVVSTNYQYVIHQGGYMDGTNCRETRDGPYGAPAYRWESNRTVKMANIGATDIVNPWLSNGRNNLRNAVEIGTRVFCPV